MTAANPNRTEPPARLRPHPQATRVPALTPEEYAMLLADIDKRGILTPLDVTAELVVLDGHQRLRAAIDLGFPSVPGRVVDVPGGDELAYLLLAALRRRQLTPSQRAAIALELEEIEQAKLVVRGRGCS
jgi:ParB-like chromosome segregation protein Spo0J